MATSEFSTGKTVFVVAIIIGCFAILWPKVFQPMMQTAFTMTKPRTNVERMESKKSSPVCCDIMYDYDIDNQFFARLCELLVERDTKKKPDPHQALYEGKPLLGVSQICRDKVYELCNIDIGPILSKNPKDPKYKEALDELHQQNLTFCLQNYYEKHEKFLQFQLKRQQEEAMRKQIRQERNPHMHPAVLHPAMREKGIPMATRMHERMSQKLKPGPAIPSPRPSPSGHGKVLSSTKGGGSMGFVMPMYTVGIVIFFIYTVMKFWNKIRDTVVLFKRSEDKSTKVMDFHMDPGYHKYVLNEGYDNTYPSSYKEYVSKKEGEEKMKSKQTLGDDERKLVFTAIEGIIAEMDEYREQLKTVHTEHEKVAKAAEDGVEDSKPDSPAAIQKKSLDEENKKNLEGSEKSQAILGENIEVNGSTERSIATDDDTILSSSFSEDTSFAVLGMETTLTDEKIDEATLNEINSKAEKKSFSFEKSKNLSEAKEVKPVPTDVPNIILDTNMPAESQLLVAESQCKAELENAEDDYEGDQSIVIAGKMTISLINSQTDGRKGDETPTPSQSSEERTPTPKPNNLSQSEEMEILPVSSSKSPSPDIDSYEMIPVSKEENGENQYAYVNSEKLSSTNNIVTSAVCETVCSEMSTINHLCESPEINSIHVEKDSLVESPVSPATELDFEKIHMTELIPDEKQVPVEDAEQISVASPVAAEVTPEKTSIEILNSISNIPSDVSSEQIEIVAEEGVFNKQEIVTEKVIVDKQEIVAEKEVPIVNKQENVAEEEVPTVEMKDIIADKEIVDKQDIVAEVPVVDKHEIVVEKETVNKEEVVAEKDDLSIECNKELIKEIEIVSIAPDNTNVSECKQIDSPVLDSPQETVSSCCAETAEVKELDLPSPVVAEITAEKVTDEQFSSISIPPSEILSQPLEEVIDKDITILETNNRTETGDQKTPISDDTANSEQQITDSTTSKSLVQEKAPSCSSEISDRETQKENVQSTKEIDEKKGDEINRTLKEEQKAELKVEQKEKVQQQEEEEEEEEEETEEEESDEELMMMMAANASRLSSSSQSPKDQSSNLQVWYYW